MRRVGGVEHFLSAGLVAYYHGLAAGAMGIVAPISGLAALVPVTVGLVGGERPTSAQLVGVTFAVTGLVLASYRPGAVHEGGRRIAIGVGMALVAALGFGTFYVLIAAASERGDILSAIALNRVAGIILLMGVWALLGGVSLSRVTARDAVAGLIGVLAVGASGLFALATTKSLVSLVAVLGALYPVTTVLLARVFLKERLRVGQRAGAASALIGVALIAG